MRVKVRSDTDLHPSWVKPDMEYVVLSIEDAGSETHVRIFSEQNETPALFPAKDFEVTSNKIPSVWSAYFGDDGQFVELMPAPWWEVGFWEDYFDGGEEAKSIFDSIADEIVAQS